MNANAMFSANFLTRIAEALSRLANAAVLSEREFCARACDAVASEGGSAEECAKRIREMPTQ